jgi:hypothetical protein
MVVVSWPPSIGILPILVAYACLSSIMQLCNAVPGNAVLGFAVLAMPSWLPFYKHGIGHSQGIDS